MAIQSMILGSRLHEAPHTGEIGDNDSKHGVPQVLGVVGSYRFGLYADFVSSSQPFFCMYVGRKGLAASPTRSAIMRRMTWTSDAYTLVCVRVQLAVNINTSCVQHTAHEE